MGSFNPITGEYQEGPTPDEGPQWPPPDAFFHGFGGGAKPNYAAPGNRGPLGSMA